jgi:carboxylesterase type B
LHQCLLEVDPKRIATYYATLPDFYVITKEAIPENGDTSEVFMEEMPGILLQQGKFNRDIPWMAGANSAEAYSNALKLLANETEVQALNAFWDIEAPLLFNYRDDESHNASQALKDFYFRGENIGKKTRKELTDCWSDINWVLPIAQSTDLHAKFGGKVFFYWITHEPVQSYGESSKQGFAAPYGVAHADEVQFLFPFDPFPVIDQKSVDFQFSTSMIKIWAEFARTGSPKVPSGEEWLPIDGSNPRESSWMELNDNRYQPVNPLKYRLQFLNSFPFLDPNYEYEDDNEQ